MELKYFSLDDDKDSLKKKYKQLAFNSHPDRNPNKQVDSTKKMQEINEEFQYCLKNGNVFSADVRNGGNISDLVSELFIVMLDELIVQEKSQSIVEFLKNMKEQFKKHPSGINDFLRVLYNVGTHMGNNVYKHPYQTIKKKKNPYTK